MTLGAIMPGAVLPVQFVGSVPLLVGLALASLVAAIAWAMYFRGSQRPIGSAGWLLPFLRAGAVFLAVLLLTGPVWLKRDVIGELGQVNIVLDTSESMGVGDKHLPVEGKLRIAEQLGWLPTGIIEWTEFDAIDELLTAVRSQRPESNIDNELAARVATLAVSLGELVEAPTRRAFDERVVIPLRAQTKNQSDIRAAFDAAREIALARRATRQNAITERITAGEGVLSSALAQFDDSDRIHRATTALAGDTCEILAQLGELHDVRMIVVNGDRATAIDWQTLVETRDSELGIDDNQLARFTDLSLAFASLEDVSEQPDGEVTTRRGVTVVFSDGRHNRGSPPAPAAEILAEQGSSVFCVGYGALDEAPDLALVDVEYPDEVFANDQVQGSVRMRDTLPQGEPFLLRIQHSGTVVWEEELISNGTGERTVAFAFPAQSLVSEETASTLTGGQPGVQQISLQAEIVPVAVESDSRNNTRPMRLGIVVDEQRVLLLDGRSRWETRYIRNAFARDERWQIDTVIAGPGTDHAQLPRGDARDQFPNSRDRLFEYDLVIMGELGPGLLTPDELDWLMDFVSLRGGGLVFIDGARGQLHDVASNQLQTLLPVRRQANMIRQAVTQIQLTDRGAGETALRLREDEISNRDFWSSLPNPKAITPTEALPDAEVLVEAITSDGPVPAIVTRTIGAGRVLYFAFDETWRWRYKAADLWHQRLWNQFARYAMPAPYATSDDYVAIDTDRMSYRAGDSVDVRVRLSNPDGSPAVSAIAEAIYLRAGEVVATIPLEADSSVDGVYRGRSGVLPAGNYEVQVRASGYSEESLSLKAPFLVEEATSAERATTSLNRPLLSELALAGGGSFLHEDHVAQLPKLLEPFSAGRVVETEIALGESYWWFAAIMLLLTVEWLLRKRHGLL